MRPEPTEISILTVRVSFIRSRAPRLTARPVFCWFTAVMPATEDMASGAYLTRAYKVMPYAKATIGPVALEAEVNYMWGDAANGNTAELVLLCPGVVMFPVRE